ncbi:hypothetical protein RE628_06435 [Paenibacillus sp. D2_2]|uniref:hypothetical protein n=1 Tax=Paenibacillus sp. D2_2 TaxID=3073092 RepID=UPI00281615D1|nr:hypothetical protein [Paenibacillus sp. D2_2]WMT42071.1 hypothetical protein RE628_06435 [Paenibacillus sp. D2_2]
MRKRMMRITLALATVLALAACSDKQIDKEPNIDPRTIIVRMNRTAHQMNRIIPLQIKKIKRERIKLRR